jgi:hypothetical protein
VIKEAELLLHIQDVLYSNSDTQTVSNGLSKQIPQEYLILGHKYRVWQASFLFLSDRSVQKRKLVCRILYFFLGACGSIDG